MRLKDRLEQLVFLGILLIVFFPLFGDYGLLLFPLGRDVFFRLIVQLLFFFYLLLILLGGCSLPKPSPLFWAVCLFWFVSLLATLFSAQPVFSFLGNPFRGHGFLSQTHFLAFFIILCGFLRKRRLWEQVLWAGLLVLFLAGVVSLFEALAGQTEKLQSTLNNPNFFAAYLLLVMFFAPAFFLKTKEQIFLREEEVFKKGFLIIVFVISLFAVFSTKSQGAYLGFLVGFCSFWLYFFWPKMTATKTRKKLFFCSLLLSVVLLSFVSLKIDLFSLPYRVSNTPIELIKGEARSAKQRFESYRTAILGIKERPLLGFGPENFVVAFDRFYRGGLESTSYPWFDKTHNIFLEVGVSTGLLGLFSYLLIWLFAFKALFPASRDAFKLGLFATFLAYLGQNLFNIDTTTSFIYVYLWWALAYFLEKESL